MDTQKILRELYEEMDQIQQAIAFFQRVQDGRGRRRGRPRNDEKLWREAALVSKGKEKRDADVE